MKKILTLIMCIIAVFTLSACDGSSNNNLTPTTGDTGIEQANQYLTEFFASYTDMCDYANRSDIELSDYTLHGADLSTLLKSMYQAQSVTFSFKPPVEVSDNTFSCLVTVEAPDMAMLYTAFTLDALTLEGEPDADFVANSFYNNLRLGSTAECVSEPIALTLRYQNKTWTLSSSNDLVNAMFPNINQITAE